MIVEKYAKISYERQFLGIFANLTKQNYRSKKMIRIKARKALNEQPIYRFNLE